MMSSLDLIVDRLADPAVRSLLGLSMGSASPERIDRVAASYAEGGHRLLFGSHRDGRIVGLVGVELLEKGRATVLHIAVDEEFRSLGLGRSLVTEVIRELDLAVLSAETDDEAVGFYEQCGFAIRPAVRRFGTRRFACELRRAD